MGTEAKEKDQTEENIPCIFDVIPVDRFPHIWKKIIANASVLSDLQSAIKTDGEDWDWILEQKRRHWLATQLLPFVTRYLSRNDVLNLRATCSSWCHGVDNFIEDTSDKQLDYLNHRFGWAPAWSQRFGSCPYLLGGSRRQIELDFDGFMESMWYHPRSPFVGGELAIQDFNEEDANHPTAELMRMIDVFIPLFGHYISYLDLTSFNSQAFMEIPNLILGVLHHTLNLKQLRLYLTHGPIVDPPNGIPGGIQVPDLIQLTKLQIVYPLFHHESTKRFPIVSALIRRHAAQLERVEVGEVEAVHWVGLSWPNLRELHATIDTKTVLRGLMNMQAPRLEKLFLWMDRRSVSAPYQWERYRLLQHFPGLEPAKMNFAFF